MYNKEKLLMENAELMEFVKNNRQDNKWAEELIKKYGKKNETIKTQKAEKHIHKAEAHLL